jgi:UDP-N-acetylmuramyl pentapeptide phosphotransferase/UDP-N-acetylglucosamine-1-phosphate transferase
VFWFNIMPVRIMKGDTMELLVGAVVASNAKGMRAPTC